MSLEWIEPDKVSEVSYHELGQCVFISQRGMPLSIRMQSKDRCVPLFTLDDEGMEKGRLFIEHFKNVYEIRSQNAELTLVPNIILFVESCCGNLLSLIAKPWIRGSN